MPCGSATPASAIVLNGRKNPPCRIIVAKRYEDLIQYNVVQNRVTRLPQTTGKPGCMTARPLNEFGYA